MEFVQLGCTASQLEIYVPPCCMEASFRWYLVSFPAVADATLLPTKGHSGRCGHRCPPRPRLPLVHPSPRLCLPCGGGRHPHAKVWRAIGASYDVTALAGSPRRSMRSRPRAGARDSLVVRRGCEILAKRSKVRCDRRKSQPGRLRWPVLRRQSHLQWCRRSRSAVQQNYGTSRWAYVTKVAMQLRTRM
jgi:hypothetical protein